MVALVTGIGSLAFAVLVMLSLAAKIPFTATCESYCASIDKWLTNENDFDCFMDFFKYLRTHKVRKVKLA